MNRKMHLRTDGLFFPFRFNQQIVCSGIQVRVGDDRLAARAVPVFGEAFQFVNDFFLIGCHVVGGGEFDAEHGLVSIQGDFLCMA